MIRPPQPTFTVPEGIRDLGREPTSHMCQWVGTKMGLWFRVRNGMRETPKRLGPKTYRSSGSHDFVAYPDDPLYRDRLEQIVIDYEEIFGRQPALQGQFFFGVEPALYIPPESERVDLRPGVELDCPLCHAPLIFPRDEGPYCQECGWPTEPG